MLVSASSRKVEKKEGARSERSLAWGSALRETLAQCWHCSSGRSAFVVQSSAPPRASLVRCYLRGGLFRGFRSNCHETRTFA